MFLRKKTVKQLSVEVSLEPTSRKPRGIPFSILGHQSFFQGKLILKGESRLGGKVEGIIIAEDLLVIEEDAHISGEIHGQNVEISGAFEGALRVEDVLRICPTAQIQGDVFASRLIIEEGAKVKGRVNSFDPHEESL